jgi:hypothetical protein
MARSTMIASWPALLLHRRGDDWKRVNDSDFAIRPGPRTATTPWSPPSSPTPTAPTPSTSPASPASSRAERGKERPGFRPCGPGWKRARIPKAETDENRRSWASRRDAGR